MRIPILITVGALALSAANATPVRPIADTTPARISFCAKVVQLVEAGCIGVPASESEARTYDVTGVHPRPAVGTLISGSGVPGGITMCNQGTHLTDVKWKKVDSCTVGH